MPGPTQRTTAAEWRVIRWFFSILAVIALIYLGYSWISRSRACDEACATSGQGEGELQSYGHGRFNSGLRCVCVKPGR
jgi:hypothetical protein